MTHENSIKPGSPSHPRLAITVGDVAGVGPELAMRCAADPTIRSWCTPLLYGPKSAMVRIADRLKLEVPSTLVDIGECDIDALVAGKFSANTGRISFQAVDQAIEDAMAGRIDAIVTGPIQKEAWKRAGIDFPGHTELLADRVGTGDFAMMLAGDELAVVLATIHVPLRDVPDLLTRESVARSIRHALNAARARCPRDRSPTVAVCGLNPHAGENGLFSHGEEEQVIGPAIATVQAEVASLHESIQIIGPLPPDTAFTPAMRRRVDVYVCMYHDQGLVPLKALSFDEGVNVTLGLPIVRTSVDHGTALDLAWQGTASDQSMRSAIRMAVDLCHRQDRFR